MLIMEVITEHKWPTMAFECRMEVIRGHIIPAELLTDLDCTRNFFDAIYSSVVHHDAITIMMEKTFFPP